MASKMMANKLTGTKVMVRKMSYFLFIALVSTYVYYYCVSNEVQLMVWGCTNFSQCVIMVRTSEVTNILLNRNAYPTKPAWCETSIVNEKVCNGYDNKEGEVGVSVSGGGDGMKRRRECAEWLYACSQNGRHSVTVWYHHFHKAGGSTFVQIAKANGATLMPSNSNGNPLDENGERIPFWSYTGSAQTSWAHDVKSKYGTDMVVTEFDFPSPSELMAPVPFMYITIFREPVSRLVSNFFWRYRRYFAGAVEPRLSPGEAPSFKTHATDHRNYYLHMLNSMLHGTPLDRSHLAGAKRSLDSFSVVLICEWLGDSSELLEKKLGWDITDFRAFHLKENSGLRDYNLVKMSYGADWSKALAEENALDVELYEYAKSIAVTQLQQHNVKLPSGAENY